MKLFGIFSSVALLAGAAAAWVTDVRGTCPWTHYFVAVAVAAGFAAIMRALYLVTEAES